MSVLIFAGLTLDRGLCNLLVFDEPDKEAMIDADGDVIEEAGSVR